MLTLVASALASSDCIDDVLRTGRTAGALGCVVKAPSTLGTFLRSFRWGSRPPAGSGEPGAAGTGLGSWGRTRRRVVDHRPGLNHLRNLRTRQGRGPPPPNGFAATVLTRPSVGDARQGSLSPSSTLRKI